MGPDLKTFKNTVSVLKTLGFYILIFLQPNYD